ncbi:MAG: hypothetical protein V3V20_00040, partial [Algisphaera sp.]
MARSLPPKTVQCYHCDHRFEVGGSAQSTSCPGCNRPVMVADQIIDKQRGPLRELKTCGKVIIKKKGRLICHHVVAHAGLECEGVLDSKTVTSNQRVIFGPKANFRGDLTAPSVDIGDGMVIQRSYFRIGEPPPGYVPPPDKPIMTRGADHPATPQRRTPSAKKPTTRMPHADDTPVPASKRPSQPVADAAQEATPKKAAVPQKAPQKVSPAIPQKDATKKTVPKKKVPKKKAPSKTTSTKPSQKPTAVPKTPADKPALKKLKPTAEPKRTPAKPASKPKPTKPTALSTPTDTPKKPAASAPKKKTPKPRVKPASDEAAPKQRVPKRRKPSTEGDKPSAFQVLT